MNHEQRFMIWSFLLLLLQSCISIDTVTLNRPISDGDLLVSSGESFALGFFSPGRSRYRYVGIWYHKISEQTVVWVANRDRPINDTTGILSINQAGNLVLHAQNIVLWSSNVPGTSTRNCTAQLLDSGNLVLVQSQTKRVMWKSFDYPTHTVLPGMKLGLDRTTGLNRFLTSWKSSDDPGIGSCSYRFDARGSSQLFLWKGPVQRWRTGPWNGLRWSGVPEMTHYFNLTVRFVDNQEESYVMYTMFDASVRSRLVVDESGSVQWLAWVDSRWILFWSAPKDRCDYYGRCGSYGSCNPNSANGNECTCLPGYEPNSPSNGSGGCVRKRVELSTCGNGDGFVKVERVKVPDTSMARVDPRMSLKACEQECLRKCSCKAYTIADIRGSGCITWYGDLTDTREYSSGGQDLYIRVDAIELAQHAKKYEGFFHKKGMLEIVVMSIIVNLFLMIFFTYRLVLRKRKGRQGRPKFLINFTTGSTSFEDSSRETELDESRTDSNLHLFKLSTIASATDNFSLANKLGEGGFGFVYKGHLVNGQEIAVKRLSKNSGQGIEEFKNEVTLIAKLQHRNLVRLFGCCIHREERMLIYEHLPNKSLDSFIFDKSRRALLDWRKRYKIIFGIARGVLYLHQDSRLRIIHRDLKASNVLLDAALNPKISDFGMARIFGGDQIEGKTKRVVGTYGYMSPEYAMRGLYSIKSDVFSFGVLLIEIICGRKNNDYFNESSSLNLIGH